MSTAQRSNTTVLFAPWARAYVRAWIRSDVLAGLSAAAVVIPQALAYATIAGLPVHVGLYCALVPMILYALLGTSRPLSVSTTSTLSILTAAAIADAPAADPLTVASTLAVLSGGLLVLASLLRLGFVADFISRPVLTGFKVGMGITIAVGQLGNVLGVPITGDGVVAKAASAVRQLPDASLPTVAVAAATVAGLLLLRRSAPTAPGPLAALVGGIVAVGVFGLPRVATVADVTRGLPLPLLPDVRLTAILLPHAAGVALMTFTESIAAARAFRMLEDRPLDADRELLALGAAGIGGGLFRAYPPGGGLSQTAVNDQAGARSQAAELVTASMVALTLLALAPLFSDLPLAVLGGIVLVAAMGLADPSGLLALRAMRRDEYALALAAALGVLVFGTLGGILVAVLLSLGVLLWHLDHPPIVRLGRDSTTGAYRDLALEPDLETVPGLLVVRVEGRLFFVNARPVTERLRELVDASTSPPAVLLLDASSVNDTDVTAAEAIEELHDTLARQGTELWAAHVEGRGRALEARRERWVAAQDRVFPTLDAAVAAFHARL
ncbi:MAG: SulP family inorganic anion transporter [Chloroflexi bacterium]|nr:SulP family inorganic anion transporter [Chloroflexota bacterium]